MLVALPMVLLDLAVGALAVYGFARTGSPILLVALPFVVVEVIADVRAMRGLSRRRAGRRSTR